MSIWLPSCGVLRDTTDVPTDVRMVAPDDVREFLAAHGGRVFVWISVHPGFRTSLCLLETSLEPRGDLGFRRIAGPGFDVYLESTQRIWPKTLEFALKRHKRVEAYWNGLAWIA